MLAIFFDMVLNYIWIMYSFTIYKTQQENYG